MHLLPFSLAARSLTSSSASVDSLLNKAADGIRNGLIGSIYQLSITQVYNPKHTNADALRSMAAQDVKRVAAVTNLPILFDEAVFFADSPSAKFGSFSTQFLVNDVRVIWQALACVSGTFDKPVRTLRLSGSEGVLQLNSQEASFYITDFKGRILQSGGRRKPQTESRVREMLLGS